MDGVTISIIGMFVLSTIMYLYLTVAAKDKHDTRRFNRSR